MSILELLGLKSSEKRSSPTTSEGLLEIMNEVQMLDDEKAHYLAAFAFLLSRVAYADMDISKEEIATIEEVLLAIAQLEPSQAALVAKIAAHQNEMRGGTENFIAAREFKAVTDKQQRLQLIDCLFAVAAADDSISNLEEESVRQIAKELGIDDRTYLGMRSRYNDKRDVVKRAKALATN
ncbi:TerB family tellurite resistance protein [Myxococcota bacterium]|nr:TerB family tellurite resistance protein [Myxococcota bacterium]